MNTVKHILVADNCQEKPSNITFLLQLAGYRVTEFSDELEACNWLLQKDPTLRPADMLLLNQPKPDRALFSLLFQLRQRITHMELLLVAPQRFEILGQIQNIDPPLRQCAASDINHNLRTIFKKSPLHNGLQAQINDNSGFPRKLRHPSEVGQEKV